MKWTLVEPLNKSIVRYARKSFPSNKCQLWRTQLKQELEGLMKPTYITIYGKTWAEKRLVMGCGDPGLPYVYSGRTVEVQPWTPTLLQIREEMKQICGWEDPPNFCLINWYRNAEDKIGAHSDNESMLRHDRSIISLSLGSTRTFRFHSLNGKKVCDIPLEDGTICEMGCGTQKVYKHSILPAKGNPEERWSLTWRWMQTHF